MIHQSEQERADALNFKLDEIKKLSKLFQKYIQETEVDSQNKKILSTIKQYSNSLAAMKEDPANLCLNFTEIFLLLENIYKMFQQQQGEFLAFYNNYFEDFLEKINGYNKKITDLNSNNLKSITSSRKSYNQAKIKYEKLCKEVETAFLLKKKNENEAYLGYNIEINSKSDTRIKDILKQIEQAEQAYKELTDVANMKTKDFQLGIQESYKQLKSAYKLTCDSLIEVTMKYDQHQLLSFNWLKGYLDEKSDKIVSFLKLSSEDEDLLIQQKCDQVAEQNQKQIKYIDLLKKLMNNEPLSDQETIAFPDLLQRFIDIQLNVINDRIKNLRTFSHFLSDLSSNLETVQKQFQKQVKTSQQQIAERITQAELTTFSCCQPGSYTRRLIQIQELLVSFHDGLSKRIIQLQQFFQIKSIAIDNNIKEQKNQEKSFTNMSSKMLKDMQFYKNQLEISDNKQNLKKIVKESAPIMKYTLDQIRSQENQRTAQVINIIGGILQQYSLYVDENIKNIKQQEEILIKRCDQLQDEIQNLPEVNLQSESIEYQFNKMFQMTAEIQSYLGLQQQQKDEQAQEQINSLIKEDEDEDRDLEEGAVKVSQRLQEKFRIVEGEKCIASYACAFDNKILLQGRMYIFTFRVCFHSYFNSKTLFGTTLLVIPANDIVAVRKTKAYLIDTALEIQTVKGSIVFTSFINRESTLSSLKQVKGLADNVQESEKKDKSSLQTSTISDVTDYSGQQNMIQTQSLQQEQSLQQNKQEQSNSNSQDIKIQPQQQQQQAIVQQAVQKEQLLNEQQQQVQQSQQSQPQLFDQSLTEQNEPIIKDESSKKQQKVQVKNTSPQKHPEIKQDVKKDPILPEKEQIIKSNKQDNESNVLRSQSSIIPQMLPIIDKNSIKNPESIQGENFYNQIMNIERSVRFMNQPQIVRFSIDLDVPIRLLLTTTFFDSQFEWDQKQYQSFFHFFQLEYCHDKDLNWQLYNPQPAQNVIARRQLSFLHPVREKVMFAPDFATCSAVDTFYLLNDKEALIEKDVTFTKIPYGDHFKFRSYYYIKELAENSTKLEYGYYIHFVKKTMFQKKIETSSKDENLEIWEQGLKPYFKLQEKKLQQQLNLENLKNKPTEELKIESKILSPKASPKIESEILFHKTPQKIEQQPEQLQQAIIPNVLETKIDYLTSLMQILIGLVVFNIIVHLFK